MTLSRLLLFDSLISCRRVIGRGISYERTVVGSQMGDRVVGLGTEVGRIIACCIARAEGPC